MKDSYIRRTLIVGDRSYSEAQLLDAGSLFIVLAEPGAGKTTLLSEFGRLLNVDPMRASIVRGKTFEGKSHALIIDAMDEVARSDQQGVENIIRKVSIYSADKVIFAGRSSEWDKSENLHVKDYFGVDPIIVKLSAFTQSEQRRLFKAHFPNENFDAFVAECERVDLDVLLGNPQFLLLFAEAFNQNDRPFVTKRAIYSDAVARLAYETNAHVKRRGGLPAAAIVEMACEVFAKIMLSGSTGVSASEGPQSREYPYIRSLVRDNSHNAHHLADTRLLKPSHDPGLHEPAHRIVAEYCAARYLVRRIDDPADRLTLPRVLAIIAPKRVVRTELRGMLGWMAALSKGSTQRQLIELDPYAVVANGDPSELRTESKKTLLNTLGQLADINPLFRWDDNRRQFNVGKFFTADIRQDVAAQLSPDPFDSPLRDLVLELLASSHAARQFSVELHTLALHGPSRSNTRKAAYSVLLTDDQFDPRPDISALLLENSLVSLELGASAVRSFGSGNFELSSVIDLLRKLSGLFSKKNVIRDRNWSSRYFINTLIDSLDQDVTVQALDQLAVDLTCDCNPKSKFECTCRVRISKIVGLLLDHHLAATSRHDPARVWRWTRALIFNNNDLNYNSPSVRHLDENPDLRQAIHRFAVSGLTGLQAKEAVKHFFRTDIHAGIRFRANDRASLAEYAFASGLVDVWSALWVCHKIYDHQKQAEPLRTLMRGQARKDARFLRVWAKLDRAASRDAEILRFKYFRPQKRRKRRAARVIEQDRAQFIANRAQIEAGQHLQYLVFFAREYLYRGTNHMNSDHGDTPLRALRNCIPYLRPRVPTLEQLSQHEGEDIAMVLFAHCLVRFRANEPLHELDLDILRAVKSEEQHYSGVEGVELDAVHAELDRLVFRDPGSALAYARAYLEPALAHKTDIPTNVEWLERRQVFHNLRETLPFEWLRRYPEMPVRARNSLFEMAAKHGDRKQLEALIDDGFDEHLPMLKADSPERQSAEHRHRFWALNAFFFSTARRDKAMAELRQHPRSLIYLADLAGRFGRHEHDHIPPLSAEAIFWILDAFVEAWPKVHLPNSYGSDEPDNQAAYRFLTDIVWRIGSDVPENRLAVLNRLLESNRFENYRRALLTLHASAIRDSALSGYRPPSVESVSALLDRDDVASVEDLRALMVEEMGHVQVELKGLDTDPLDTFYDGGKRVSENKARNRVVDMIRGRLTARAISVVIEHHMSEGNRADFTATASVSGSNAVLVVEAKGQWHAELFTAAAEQLQKRYSIFPAASGQGVYLVFWFGNGEKVAGRVEATIASASDLRNKILEWMPEDLQNSIDVVVLDLSRPQPVPKPAKPKGVSKSRRKSRADTTAAVSTRDVGRKE